MPESVRLCPFHMPFGIPYNLTGNLLALPTIEKSHFITDVDKDCISKAILTKSGDKTSFICCGFEEYNPGRQFDAVVFVASIHHMNMPGALDKAKSLLNPGGKLLIVGLAKPSTAADFVLEAVRVLPSKAISILHHMKSSEELKIATSYDYPQMQMVRSTVREKLPNARITYGLHYRYLLEWSD